MVIFRLGVAGGGGGNYQVARALVMLLLYVSFTLDTIDIMPATIKI